jgi:hypothetical protein
MGAPALAVFVASLALLQAVSFNKAAARTRTRLGVRGIELRWLSSNGLDATGARIKKTNSESASGSPFLGLVPDALGALRTVATGR